jgi:hypothetical protein
VALAVLLGRSLRPLAVLRRAVDLWLQLRPPIQFAVHFGDIVDSSVAHGTREQSEKAVRSVLDQFARLACRTYHMLGELRPHSKISLVEDQSSRLGQNLASPFCCAGVSLCQMVFEIEKIRTTWYR